MKQEVKQLKVTDKNAIVRMFHENVFCEPSYTTIFEVVATALTSHKRSKVEKNVQVSIAYSKETNEARVVVRWYAKSFTRAVFVHMNLHHGYCDKPKETFGGFNVASKSYFYRADDVSITCYDGTTAERYTMNEDRSEYTSTRTVSKQEPCVEVRLKVPMEPQELQAVVEQLERTKLPYNKQGQMVDVDIDIPKYPYEPWFRPNPFIRMIKNSTYSGLFDQLRESMKRDSVYCTLLEYCTTSTRFLHVDNRVLATDGIRIYSKAGTCATLHTPRSYMLRYIHASSLDYHAGRDAIKPLDYKGFYTIPYDLACAFEEQDSKLMGSLEKCDTTSSLHIHGFLCVLVVLVLSRLVREILGLLPNENNRRCVTLDENNEFVIWLKAPAALRKRMEKYENLLNDRYYGCRIKFGEPQYEPEHIGSGIAMRAYKIK
ncbi:MAG: hypothetical protein RR382_00655 [Tannerellaceae bacterium]